MVAALLMNIIVKGATKGAKRGNVVKLKRCSHKTCQVKALKRKGVCLPPTTDKGWANAPRAEILSAMKSCSESSETMESHLKPLPFSEGAMIIENAQRGQGSSHSGSRKVTPNACKVSERMPIELN